MIEYVCDLCGFSSYEKKVVYDHIILEHETAIMKYVYERALNY